MGELRIQDCRAPSAGLRASEAGPCRCAGHVPSTVKRPFRRADRSLSAAAEWQQYDAKPVMRIMARYGFEPFAYPPDIPNVRASFSALRNDLASNCLQLVPGIFSRAANHGRFRDEPHWRTHEPVRFDQ